MTSQLILRNGLVILSFLFLLYLICRKKQTSQLNWSLFYAGLWVFLSLPIINWLCVALGFWKFSHTAHLPMYMPYDLLFVWVVAWGIVVPYVFKGAKLFLVSLVLLWIDLLYMPYLETLNIIKLGKYWLIGEVLVILFVFMPAFLWSKLSLRQTRVNIRSLFQFLSMAIILCAGIPFITLIYFPQEWSMRSVYTPYIVQFGLIILLPAIVAVIDLCEKGGGTPFPYDPTRLLVRTGVYAYIRNPIQWSITLFFIPLSIFYSSPLLLAGIIVSIAYTIGVSNPQEFESMQQRFGKAWRDYKKSVPAWFFLWKPVNYPKGTVYFKRNCTSCASVRRWLELRNPHNLVFKHAEDFQGKDLLQVRYIDHLGVEANSVKAIASCLEHINLGWATMGWFMRLPGVRFVLQSIVDTMAFESSNGSCSVDKPSDVNN